MDDWKKLGACRTKRSARSAVRHAPTETDTSPSAPSNSVRASEIGVPRRQSRAVRAYPDVVMLPGPKSPATSSASSSYQVTLCFASGRRNPPSTNARRSRSNSRTSTASAPPRESRTRQRRYSGSRHVAPPYDQFTPSSRASRSTSSTVSHEGEPER
jgi:hypothetical protein